MAAQPRKRKNPPASALTPGTTIRFEEPHSGRSKPKHNVTAVVVHEYNPVGGFLNFLREHSVVSLAVGFAIATQAQSLIKQLITSFIDPMYALLFHGDKLSVKTFSLHFRGSIQQFAWGAFVYTLIDFLFVLAAIYAVIKIFNLDKLDKPTKQEIDRMKEIK